MVASSTTAELDRLLSLAAWTSPEAFLAADAPRLAPLWRTLLTTDGSTTLFLQALCRAPITLEQIDQQPARLPPLTGWLELAPGRPVVQRRVWLTGGGRRLALGYALILRERLSPAVQKRLAEGTHPIGLLAEELELPSVRDRLQVGRLTDPALARQFGSSGETLWCRRYRLHIPDAMTAAILEIFSPSLDEYQAP
ncbi:MAG TPA: chorismate pyruvate-lyase family protein [Nitrospiria bacterium]|nr:chorismate pyruvate-lyase family protein [Nitrospiria bacterium]